MGHQREVKLLFQSPDIHTTLLGTFVRKLSLSTAANIRQKIRL